MESTPEHTTKPNASPIAQYGGLLAGVVLLLRLATCYMKTEADARTPAIDVSAIANAPANQCRTECMFYGTPGDKTGALGDSNQCVVKCERAKARKADIDYGATARSCRLPCMMRVRALASDGQEGPATDAGRSRGATESSGGMSTTTQPATSSPVSAGSAKSSLGTPSAKGRVSEAELRGMLDRCVDQCVDTLIGGEQFNALVN